METLAWRAWRFQGDFGALGASGLVAESRAPSGALPGGMEPWLGLRLGPRPATADDAFDSCFVFVVIATRVPGHVPRARPDSHHMSPKEPCDYEYVPAVRHLFVLLILLSAA